MKFLVTKDLSHSRLLSYLIAAVVLTILLYLGLDVLLHHYVIGLDIPTIQTNLYGNVETFEEPLLIDSLLLQVHIDLFMTLFALLILTSIYIRLYANTRFIKPLLHTVLGLGIATPIFLLMAYLSSHIFIYIWLFSFFTWHAISIFVSLAILKKLSFK